jgi:hypothetical protein
MSISRIFGFYKSTHDPSRALWEGLEFADAAQCVTIRQELRRYSRRGVNSDNPQQWRATPPDWHSLFTTLPEQTHTEAGGPRFAVRGWHDATRATVQDDASTSWLELAAEPDDAKTKFCRPIDQSGIKGLLPDDDTVIVVAFFHDDDLVVLPLRRDYSGQPQLLHPPHGYFRVSRVRPRINALLQEQEGFVYAVVDADLHEHPASALDQQLGEPTTDIYERLYETLKLDELLKLIEPDLERRAKLHLVLIPDGPLYGLPLHAACPRASEPRLYQQVASLRYGLSLSTLDLQRQLQENRVEEEADRVLRGVAFAEPDRQGRIRFLEGVIREVGILVEETGSECWWLHGEREPVDQQAVRANFRQRHRVGNLGWVMGHGGELPDDVVTATNGRTQRVIGPCLLLHDGPVGVHRLVADGYDLSHWRLVNFSCCLLGRLTPMGISKEVMGYIAVLTMLGCRRVTSAMWPISDQAAAEFSRHWIRAIKKHVFGTTTPSPHAFAVAFKEALDGFRHADGGRFDHEFFWAPYTLYGLG